MIPHQRLMNRILNDEYGSTLLHESSEVPRRRRQTQWLLVLGYR